MTTLVKDMSSKLARSAFDLFARHGINNVNMDMIAAHSNCTKGSLYWHYDTKKTVILAACDLYYRNWEEQMRHELANVKDPVKRLKKAVHFSIRHCMVDSKNRVFTLGIMGLALYDEDIKKSWAGFYDMVREFLIVLVNEAKKTGRVKVEDARRVVDLMLVAFEGIKLRTIIEPDFDISAEEKAIYNGLMEVLKCSE
ncbi:MAG: TetR/AcrR family transcriptional regulator [Kiritimatiellae bacterium]|nr:TetR/AcrR family transcriptional regulator [Kiritimatiellia bacterium]MDD5519820.1 TetR/AcrR family transcriptional regulator [Kiritimatiellia bacterium]